jgi:hypothetical protein
MTKILLDTDIGTDVDPRVGRRSGYQLLDYICVLSVTP